MIPMYQLGLYLTLPPCVNQNASSHEYGNDEAKESRSSPLHRPQNIVIFRACMCSPGRLVRQPASACPPRPTQPLHAIDHVVSNMR